MKNFWIVLGLTVVLAGCTAKDKLDIPTGADVTVEKTDGVTVAGRLVEVKPDQVVVESRDGVKTRVPRSQIASMRASLAPVVRTERKDLVPPPAAPDAPPAPSAPIPDDKAASGSAEPKTPGVSAPEAQTDSKKEAQADSKPEPKVEPRRADAGDAASPLRDRTPETGN